MIVSSSVKSFVAVFSMLMGVAAYGQTYLTARGLGSPKYKDGFVSFSYANAQAPKRGTIHLFTSRQFDCLNPFIPQGVTPDGIQTMYARLMKVPADDPTTAYPYIAERVEVAKDAKSVTFFLRPQARFHDNTPITAADVEFSFHSLMKHAFPIYRVSYDQVARVECINSHTVRFSFKTPSKDLPFMLGKMAVFSKKYHQIHPFKDGNVPPLGSGPYRITYKQRAADVTYVRIKNWWGENLPVNRGFYNFDAMHYALFVNQVAGFEGFKKGIIDVWNEERIGNWMTGYDVEAVRDGSIVRRTYHSHATRGMPGLFINTRRPHLQDRRVRHALNLLFNFEWLNTYRFYNSYKRNTNMYTDSGFGALGPLSREEKKLLKKMGMAHLVPELENMKPLPTNTSGHLNRSSVDQAIKLFKEAGWVIRDKKLVHRITGRPFSITFLFFSPNQGKLFEDYALSLRKMGIKVSYNIVDRGSYYERLNRFDYDIILHYHPSVTIPGPEQVDFWGSGSAMLGGTLNLSGVQNPAIDRLIDGIQNARSISELKLYSSLIDRLLQLNYYLIPTWLSVQDYVAYWNKLKFIDCPDALDDIHVWWMLRTTPIKE